MDFEEKYIRLYADFENYKKAHANDIKNAKAEKALEMIDVLLDIDSELSIALSNIGESEGLSLIISKLKSKLNSIGVDDIQTDTYDSDIHDVVAKVGDGNDIKSVVSKGYSMNGRVVKHPKVIIG